MSDFKAKMHQIRFWLGLWGLLLREGEGRGSEEGTGEEGPSCLSVAPWLRILNPPLNPSQSYGTSLAIWNHAVLSAT